MCITDGFGAISMVLGLSVVEDKCQECLGAVRGFFLTLAFPFILIYDFFRRFKTKI